MAALSARFPRELYQAAQVQQLDRIAIEQFQIEGFSLMRRAGLVSFQALQERWPGVRRIVCFCGSGNNGGDGYIVAGLAQEQGLTAEVIGLADPTFLQGDARHAWEWAVERGVKICNWAECNPAQLNSVSGDSSASGVVLVDALLGTGLGRDVTGDYLQAIRAINDSGLPVIALDIPSGLSADSGMPLGCAVKAQLTVTFIGMKRGLLTGQAGNFTGELLYSDLDIPAEVWQHDTAPVAACSRIDINDVTALLPVRPPANHKGDNGHVLIIGGDTNMGGAALLAAEAALRGGAGLVSVLTRSVHRPALLARRPELMVMGTEDEDGNRETIHGLLQRATAIVVGPGLGRSEWSRQQFQRAMSMQVAANTPLVVDADALNLLAGNEKESPNAGVKRDNWILTPHPGEAATLLNCANADIQKDRFAAINALQERWGGCCLLKGFGSLLRCPNSANDTLLSTEGNAGMGTGGMGDVLAGLCGSFLAQGFTLDNALQTAVCIHGEAADLAATNGQRGLLAADLMHHIQQLVNPHSH